MNKVDVEKRFSCIMDFLEGIYNQDVWSEFSTHQMIWDDYIEFGNKAQLDGFIAETQQLVSMPKETFELFAPHFKSSGMMLDEESLLPFLLEVVEYIGITFI